MKDQDEYDLDAQAALYAAGALSVEESVSFAALLEHDASAIAAMQPYLGVVASLAAKDPPVEPSAIVKSRLLDQIARTSKQPSVLFQRIAEANWKRWMPGIERVDLFADRASGRFTTMIRMQAGAIFPPHEHDGIEELFLLEGDLEFDDRVFQVGDYQRFEPGSHHAPQRSKSGCVALIITTIVSKA